MTPIPLITYAEGPLVVGQTLYSYTSSVALNLISYRTLMRSGTSVSIQVRKNGTLLDVLEIAALDSGVVTIPNLFFADTDVLTLVVSAAVGTPTGVSITFQCTVEDAVDQSAVQLARRIQTPLVARFEGNLVDESTFFKFVPSQQIGVTGYTISLRTAADANVVIDLQQAGTTVAQLTLTSGSLVASGALAAYFNTGEELTLKLTSIGGALPGKSLLVLLDYSNIQQTSFSSFQTPFIVEYEDIQATSNVMLYYTVLRAVTLAVGQLFSRSAPNTAGLATLQVNAPGTLYAVGDTVTLTGGSFSTAGVAQVSTVRLTSATLNAAGTTMVPGVTLTLVGGTFTTAAQLLVTTTKVVSVTLLTNGSGGYTGAPLTSPISGTTGTGTKVTFSGTLPGNGTLSAVSLVGTGTNGGGSYTVNPTNLSSEPLSGSWAVAPTVSLVMGVETFSIPVAGSYSVASSTFTSTGGGSNATFSAAVFGINTVTTPTPGAYVDPLPASFTQTSSSGSGSGATFLTPTWAYTNVSLQVGLYQNGTLRSTLSLAAGSATSTPVALDFAYAVGDLLEARVLSVATHDGLLLTLDYYIQTGNQAASYEYYSDPQTEIVFLARQIGIGNRKADSMPMENLEKYQQDVDQLLNGRLRALYRTPLAKVARGHNPWPGAIQTIAQRLVLQRLLNDVFSDIEPNASANVAANARLAADDLQQLVDRQVLLEGQRLRAKNYGSNPATESLAVVTATPSIPQ